MFWCLSASLFAQSTAPERIISLGPAITRQLSALGVDERIVGVTTYCNLPNLKDRQRIGTLLEADVEKIITLRPDIVIATSLTNPKTIQKLRNLKINVIILEDSENFYQLSQQFLKLSRIVDREQIAKRIINTAKEKVALIQQKVKNLHKVRVIVQVGANPLWVATKNSLINDFIELAGGTNVGPTGTIGLISREYMVKNNPEVIIITTMGIEGEREKEIWKRFPTIDAVKNGNIHLIDPYKIGSPTPVSFPETLEEIAKLLHPEIE